MAILVVMVVVVVFSRLQQHSSWPRHHVSIPFTERNKRGKSMGIRRVTSSSTCLILVMRQGYIGKKEKKRLRKPGPAACIKEKSPKIG
eukprot:177475-Pelagomonas_calceolata.AAC.7